MRRSQEQVAHRTWALLVPKTDAGAPVCAEVFRRTRSVRTVSSIPIIAARVTRASLTLKTVVKHRPQQSNRNRIAGVIYQAEAQRTDLPRCVLHSSDNHNLRNGSPIG
jgi:hypothetical protein